jgi:hypothetical protein
MVIYNKVFLLGEYCLSYYQHKLDHNLLSNASARRGRKRVKKRKIGEERRQEQKGAKNREEDKENHKPDKAKYK